MLVRHLHSTILELLGDFPAVAIMGPRQVGKTTLAHQIALSRPSLYLDLESPADRAKLGEPELFLNRNEDKLVVLDEIHRMPEIFSVLRGTIDRGKQRGLKSARFLILGSASIDLLRQSGESLAGRVAYADLTPLNQIELSEPDPSQLWSRGGFPDSFLARSDSASFVWRENFITTYLERDLPQFGPRMSGELMRRLWTMLAHQQGCLRNSSGLARSLGVDSKTVSAYIDLLCNLLLVRKLAPWSRNSGKRLTKSPKVFIRDSGIAHALLTLRDYDELISHPVVGLSWEGFVLENLLSVAPKSTRPYFYRASGGAEIDIVLELPGSKLWAIEVKRSLNPKPKKGFYFACEDINPTRKLVIYPGNDPIPVASDITALSLTDCMTVLLSLN